MDRICVEKPNDGQLSSMGVNSWPIWKKGVSHFGWSYDDTEICYILEGCAKVQPEGGEAVEFGPGDMVTFPKGMKCTWEIKKAVKKYYKIG